MRTAHLSIVIAAVLIGGAILLVGSRKNSNNAIPRIIDNVSVVEGKQIIEISAKGGYSPQITVAKADLPTVLKVYTRGTFDCSSALVIPSLGYRNNLPMTGETLIDIPSQEVGSILNGLCSMGMYNFQIQFN